MVKETRVVEIPVYIGQVVILMEHSTRVNQYVVIRCSYSVDW